MKMNNFTFVEYALRSFSNRHGLITSINDDYPDCYGNPDTVAYMSVYRFDNNIQNFCDINKSVAEYKGTCRAVGLHFDFDGITAQDDVKNFCERVCSPKKEYDKYKLDIENFRFYFSGNKGFHFFIQWDKNNPLAIPSANTPIAISKVCQFMAGRYKSFDKAVYDKTRLIRVINSKHHKSGLYKIPLFAMELWELSFDQIKKLAKKQRKLSDDKTIREYITGKFPEHN